MRREPTERPRLLLVEDDDQLANLILEFLGPHGFELSRVATGEEATQRIHRDPPDLVVLDLMLPGANGLDVCRQVRDTFRGALIMLTASQSAADHVAGLELGADDFITKPIEPRVLLARIRTQLRRLRGKRAEPIKTVDVGPIQVDLASRDVLVSGARISLTTMEFDVLALLARHAGSVVERDDLYTQILGIEYDGMDRGMDVHVSRIRRKLKRAGVDPHQLKSVRGVGYLLAVR
ncbi:MAG: response regulator transcription factor [Myxococcota bacterium]